MKINRKKFGGVKLLLVVVVLGLAGWYIYTATTAKKPNNTFTEINPAEPKKKPTMGSLALDTKKLPKEWAIDDNNPTHISLSNKTTGCFVDMNKIDDINVKAINSQSITKQQYDQTIANIKSKGYDVTQLPNSTLNMVANNTPEQLTTLDLGVAGPQTLAQSYAYLVRDNYYIQIQRTCNNQADLTSTDPALGAIVIQN